MTPFSRMCEVARETIQKETHQSSFPSLVDRCDPAQTTKSSVIHSVCHEILKKMRTAFEEDHVLSEFRKNSNPPPYREKIFYSQLEESVKVEVDKLPIKFLDEKAIPEAAKKPLYPRVTSICSRVFAFFNFGAQP